MGRDARSAIVACWFIALAIVQPAAAQQSILASDARISQEMRRQVDEILLAADGTRNYLAISQTLVELLQAADWLDFAELELRLRELNARSRLIAVPVEAAAPGLTAMFPGKPSTLQAAARVPPFSLWVGVNGAAEAEQKLQEVHAATARDNLARLRLTGVLTPLHSAHERFEPRPDAARVPSEPSAAKMYEVLSDYVRRGYVSRESTHLVARVVNDYLVQQGGSLRFSVNQLPDSSIINVYVLASDPDGHFSRLDCNCGYVPGTRAIICDDKFLRQFRRMIHIDDAAEWEGAEDVIQVINVNFSYFLLQWIVGHELGHLVLGHDFETNYFDAHPMLTAGNRVPPKVRRDFELAADRFAIEKLSGGEDYFFAWLGLSNVISHNYGDAIRRQREKDDIRHVPGDIRPLDAKDKVVLRDLHAAHPPFLLRATQLANTVLDVHKGKIHDTTGHFDRVLGNLSVGPEGIASPTMCSAQREEGKEARR